MLQLLEGQVVQHRFEVLWELGDKACNVEIRVHSVAHCKVVSFSQNLDSMWERSLASYSLLESSAGCSPNVDFSVE
jgi:hypothetical protein